MSRKYANSVERAATLFVGSLCLLGFGAIGLEVWNDAPGFGAALVVVGCVIGDVYVARLARAGVYETPSGVEIRYPFATKSVPWTEISGFDVSVSNDLEGLLGVGSISRGQMALA
jgi:hypothetical protein